MLQFTLHFLILLSGWRCRPVFLSVNCFIFSVELLPCLRIWKLEPSFKYSISWCEWTFKNISHWRSIRLTLKSQTTKCYASSAESRETPSSTYHLTKGKWTIRSLWTPYRRQNIWWVGSIRSDWWIFSEKYFWRFIQWRGNKSRKVYLWRSVQVFSLWDK